MTRYSLFLILAALLTSSCNKGQSSNPLPHVASGSIERIDLFPSEYVSPRNVDVWLPEGYSADKKYAVLYMHDGQMLFDSTTTWNKQEWGVDEVMSRLIQEDSVRPAIVVGIWNSGDGRHADYFPQKPYESLSAAFRDSLRQALSGQPFPAHIRSDAYLKFIVKELKPYIDNHYSTLTDRDHTFTMGSSMGGLISMYAICEYPDIFGGAACMSTHWPGIFTTHNNPIPQAFADYMRKNLPSPRTHRLYFDYGTKTLDAAYAPFQMKVDSVMRERGYDGSNWETLKFEGHNHSERSWHKRLNRPLKFLLGKASIKLNDQGKR